MESTNEAFGPRQIIDNIYFIGCIDWNARLFHGFRTEQGATYNSYLIKLTRKDTGKPFAVIIDGVKGAYKEIHYEKIINCCRYLGIENGPSFLISNHSEQDHSGSIPYLHQKFPDMKIVANANCIKNNKQMHFLDIPDIDNSFILFNPLVPFIPYENVENASFVSIPTPLLHWEDSSMTFYPTKKVLFSNDAFGCHIASDNIWTEDSINEHKNPWVSFVEYAANILAPFATQMKTALTKIKPLIENHEIEYILTAHGTSFRRKEDIIKAVKIYEDFSLNTNHLQTPSITIIYDSMYGQTEYACTVLSEAIMRKNPKVVVNLCDVKETHITNLATYVWSSAGVIFGSPTMNNSPLPTIASAIVYLRGLHLLQGRAVAVVGGYNWNGAAIPEMSAMLEHKLAKCKFIEPEDISHIKFRIHCDQNTISKLNILAETMAKTVLDMCNEYNDKALKN